MKIVPDTKAKTYCKKEIIINAPTEKIFSLLQNVSSWPEWQSSVTKTNIKGAPKEGKEFIWISDGLKIKSKFHTIKKPSEIGWTGKILWIRAVHNWHLIRLGKRTKIIVKEHLKGIGSGFLRKTLCEGINKNLKELKRKAEK
jgi:hypothetical protein